MKVYLNLVPIMKQDAQIIRNSGWTAKMLSDAFRNRGVDITPQAISQWTTTPPARVLDVEAITGISRYKLRPKIFGPEPEKEKG